MKRDGSKGCAVKIIVGEERVFIVRKREEAEG